MSALHSLRASEQLQADNYPQVSSVTQPAALAVPIAGDVTRDGSTR